MSVKLTGTIKVLSRPISVDTKTGPKEKVLMVLTTTDKYPIDVPVEFFGKNSTLPNGFAVGDMVEVDANISTFTYDGKLRVAPFSAWRIADADAVAEAAAPAPSGPAAPAGEDDDLPF